MPFNRGTAAVRSIPYVQDGEIEVVDSVESYCARMQLELCEPLMKFATSAKAYFK